MHSLWTLQDWCRDVCEGYADVQITDLSSSFTDGLAFCAIIHKHRPDLLDFHALSKHSVYENMRLAFGVAERELGIPALLDPNELMCEEEPDLLSIITYISQLYRVFSSKTHDSWKIPVTEPSRTRAQEQLFSSDVIRSSDKSVCGVCHTHVHLIQRVLVKGRLYHRACFKCSVCCRSLLPMCFTDESETGSLQCSYHCKPAAESNQHSQNQTSETDVRGETDKNKSGTHRDRGETDKNKSGTHRDRGETDKNKSETHRDRGETDKNKSETHRDRGETDKNKSETHRDRGETDGDRYEMDGDRGETDGDGMGEEHLSSSSETDIRETPKPAPRKRAEPQEPLHPAPRSKDPPPHNVSSQMSIRKDHPWLKLVHPGPWYHLPPAPAPVHSRCRPVTFNPFLEKETKDEKRCETSVAHKPQTSSTVPSMHWAAAPAHGFPLIKRKVITDTRVSERQVCEEQKELEEHLQELERRGVELERDMRRRNDEKLLVDWFTLIHEKNMLVRRDAELVYMLKQQRLEDQQADVEFEIRRLFNKPERLWTSNDRHQEHQLMSRLLSIIQQRNDIISSLDLDRQREEEEDVMLAAVIQRTELQTQTDKQLDRCSRRFKSLHTFQSSKCKTKNTSSRKKNS